MRFSELESLDAAEFELFLDVLGEAVAVGAFPSEAVDILSGDGCLRVRLEPTADGDEARILTNEGMFIGPDQWISIEPVATARDSGGLMSRGRIQTMSPEVEADRRRAFRALLRNPLLAGHRRNGRGISFGSTSFRLVETMAQQVSSLGPLSRRPRGQAA